MSTNTPASLPTPRHMFCDDQSCKICLDDAWALLDYIQSRLGKSYTSDWLGRYRTWLDEQENKGWNAETEHGWFHPNVFLEENVEAFISDLTQ